VTRDLCRKDGISSATFYNWKAKYGGPDVSAARRLKALRTRTGKVRLARPICRPEALFEQPI
jgi:hypothetical protein